MNEAAAENATTYRCSIPNVKLIQESKIASKSKKCFCDLREQGEQFSVEDQPDIFCTPLRI